MLAVLSISAFVTISAVYLVTTRIRFSRAESKFGVTADSTHFRQDFVEGLIFILSIYVLIGFLDVTIVELQKEYTSINIRYSILLIASFAVILSLIVARITKTYRINLVRIFNLFLLILSVLASFSLAISIVSNYDKVFGNSVFTEQDEIDLYDRVRFKFTPNIYLIVPDSYPSNSLLARFFNFDNHNFTRELQQYGFTLYDNYFASYPFSVPSMHSMLSMKHNYLDRSIGMDSVNLRKLIGGRGNNVVNILKKNGYRSVYVHETLFLVKGNCIIDKCLPQWSVLDGLQENLQNFYFFDFPVAKFERLRQKIPNYLPAAKYDYNVGRAMERQIAGTEERSRTFIYKHFMDAHSGVKNYAEHYGRMLPEFRKAYPARIEKANHILLEEVAHILQKDQSAIIIIVADHGTWAGADRSEFGLTENETLDKLNVFLAIRWGPAYDGEYDNRIKTSVNLFRYIFAYLSRNEEILETIEDDDGYIKYEEVWKVLENGVVLKDPIRY